MNHIWIENIADGQLVDGVYYLRAKNLGTSKAGKRYLTLTLSDRTGELEGKIWENAEEFDAKAAPGDFIFIQARGNVWQNQVQLVINYFERVNQSEVDSKLFLPVCPRDTAIYWSAVEKLVAGLGDAPLRALCRAALDDPEIGAGLQKAPAATAVHQAYIGGLIEHVCSIMLLAHRMCEQYPTLDRDLLLAGALFHDLGKIRELSYALVLDYTDEGKLIGHHVFGIQYLNRLAEKIEDLPRERVMQLEHMIISHHGRPEFGSVKPPMFAEAAVLHHIDNIDTKVFGFLEAEASITQGNWSDRKWFLETAAFRLARPGRPGYRFNLLPEKTGKKDKTDADLPLFTK